MSARRIARSCAAVVLAALLVAPAASAWAAGTPPQVTSGELVEHPEQFDGRKVSFTGEAIGSAMQRGETTWLHLNDDAYGLAEGSVPLKLAGYNSGHAVLVPNALAHKITHFGSHRQRGDLVNIEGVFRAAAPEHGGDMMIEADTLEIVRVGETLERPVSKPKLIALLGLTAAAAGAFVALRFKRYSVG